MKTLLVISTAHILGVAAVAALGLALNKWIATEATEYQGLMTVCSVAFGLYCFAINFLYHKSPSVYLAVNRVLLLLRRTHTYWLPAIDYALSDTSRENRQVLFGEIKTALAKLPHRKISQTSEMASGATICVDDKLYLVFRLDEAHLFVSLDRKILVPSHLYEVYQQHIARIAEIITEVAKPNSVRLGMTITFDDEAVNPYYGFFVRRVPSHVLRHFEASFQFGHSSCRIEAGTTSINIEGTSPFDFFSAVAQVLALKATPVGGLSG